MANLSAQLRLTLKPLIVEVRHALLHAWATIDPQGATAPDPANGLVNHILRQPEGQPVDRRAVAAVTHLEFTHPKKHVRAAILAGLPDGHREHVDSLLAQIAVSASAWRVEQPPTPDGTADLLDAMHRSATGMIHVVGSEGNGRHQLTHLAAAAWAERWQTPTITIPCGGRDPDLPRDPASAMAALELGLGYDLRDRYARGDPTARIRDTLRDRPCTIVFDAVVPSTAAALGSLLAVPPGRCRVLLTTTAADPTAEAVHVPDLSADGARAILVEEHQDLKTATRLDALARHTTGSRYVAALAARVLRGAASDPGSEAADVDTVLLALVGAEAPMAQLASLVTSAASAITRGDPVPVLALLAHSPSDLIYADLLLAIDDARGNPSDPANRSARQPGRLAHARHLMDLMQRYGLLVIDQEGPGAGQSPWIRFTRPAWRIAHPLLRKVARSALEQLPADTNERFLVAMLHDLISRAKHNATPMTLPVGPWPARPGNSPRPGWYDRHQAELVQGCLRAQRQRLPALACTLAELLAGHLERRASWFELDEVTRAAHRALADGRSANPADPDDDMTVEVSQHVRVLLLRTTVLQKLHRVYDRDADLGANLDATQVEPGATQLLRAASAQLPLLDHPTSRAILACWIAGFRARIAYSQPGATLTPVQQHLTPLQTAIDGLAVPTGDQQSVGALRAAGFAWSMMGRLQRRTGLLGTADVRGDGAVGSFLTALDRWHRAGDHEGEAYALLNASRVMRMVGGQRDATTHQALRQALPTALRPLLSTRGTDSPLALSSDLAQLALERFADLHHLRGVGDAHHNLGRVYRQRGEHQRALTHVSAAIEMFADLQDTRRRSDAEINAARTSLEAGDPQQALRLLPTDVGGLPPREHGYLLVSRARTHVDLGDYDDADTDYAAALEQWRELDDGAGRAHILLNWAVLDAIRGRPPGMGKALSAVQAHARLTDPVGLVYATASLAQCIWRLGRLGLPMVAGNRPANLWELREPTTGWSRPDAIWLIREAQAMAEGVDVPHAKALVNTRVARFALRAAKGMGASASGVLNAEQIATDALDRATRANRSLGSPRMANHIRLAEADLLARQVLGTGAASGADHAMVDAAYASAAEAFAGGQDWSGQLAALHRRAHSVLGRFWCESQAVADADATVLSALSERHGLKLPPCVPA